MCPVTLAFEGVNGAGKSRVIDELRKALELQERNRVNVVKIGGLGTGKRMDCLRTILTHREQKSLRNELNQKELNDYQKDAIFRLAYRYQVTRFVGRNTTEFSHVLFDRTPLMSWAYTAAAFPNSPYLDEVRDDAVVYTARLAIQRVFLFQVRPAAVYGRIFARNVKFDPSGRTVKALAEHVRAPENVVREARDIAASVIADPRCTGKPFSIWDYMPYDHLVRQLETYGDATSEAAQLLGFTLHQIDGENEIDLIVTEIIASLGDS